MILPISLFPFLLLKKTFRYTKGGATVSSTFCVN